MTERQMIPFSHSKWLSGMDDRKRSIYWKTDTGRARKSFDEHNSCRKREKSKCIHQQRMIRNKYAFFSFLSLPSITHYLPVTIGRVSNLEVEGVKWGRGRVMMTPADVPIQRRSLQVNRHVTRKQASLCWRMMSSQPERESEWVSYVIISRESKKVATLDK